jgi:hypothetical protein
MQGFTVNAERASRGARALDYYSQGAGYDQGDREAFVTDLMTDLLHYCDAHGIDPEVMAERVQRHYKAERYAGRTRR